jgi:lipoyl(octanoyl) transferase
MSAGSDAFSGIVPCGISASHFCVTSLRDLGVQASMSEVNTALRETFEPVFGASFISW